MSTPPASGPSAGEVAKTPAEKVQAILEQIRPFLQRDGGDLEYLAYDEGVVTLRLQGACNSCPSSTMTLKMGIERALRDHVPEVRTVVTVE